MNFPKLIQCSLRLIGLFCLFSLQPTSLADRTPPNIILMLADDMGMGDTSAYQDITGNQDTVQLHTPAMERLARMGVRFSDAHTPSSRCTTTRYSLLTGRYAWRSRLKHWVLFGSQGDPMIEADRPTIASMLKDAGYHTCLVGKWHVGLRYRRSDGQAAAGWKDADLRQPLHTSPLDHGFDHAFFTSRSHGTSGPGQTGKGKRGNTPNQNVGPGHIHGRRVIAATDQGKQLASAPEHAYVLEDLGGRHSDHAMHFLQGHIKDDQTRSRPFFLYYPANANHGPYTPDDTVGDRPVAGASSTKSGEAMDARHDFIYENDVALGRLLDWLEATEDPRRPGSKLIDNTLVLFTSDNGAEKNSRIATGPFRSHKGSVFEGGHRVPFMAAWKQGGVGDGDADTPGQTRQDVIALQDLYATFAEIIHSPLPDLTRGEKGAEDSFSILSALRGEPFAHRPPLFFNDHKESKQDPAACALRIDHPTVDGQLYKGQWKVFFDASLLRFGTAKPVACYNLSEDPEEQNDLLHKSASQPLIRWMSRQAAWHRNVGGHRLASLETKARFQIQMTDAARPLRAEEKTSTRMRFLAKEDHQELPFTLEIERQGEIFENARLDWNEQGLGVRGGGSAAINQGEALLIRFQEDVLVESVAIRAGQGACGGYCQVGSRAPLAIYCVDADQDAKDQHGRLSDLGVLKAGEILRLDSRPHLGVETPGQWRLAGLSVRTLARPASLEPVKVFILAGQSNMEGKGFPRPLAWQVSQEAYRDRYTRFIKDGDSIAFTRALEASLAADPKRPVFRWASRSDVWVDFHDRHGDLQVGYSPNQDCFGPEFNFGQVMGDHFQAPVLIIKTAWGGKALGRGFLPPSLRDTLEERTAIASEEGKTLEEIEQTHGAFYDRMLEEIRSALAHLKSNHPEYRNQGYELKGFVWFQGWNDLFKAHYRDRYADRLATLIRDVRSDLNAPDLPVVIGQMGHDGDKKGIYPVDASGALTSHGILRKAQWDVAQLPEFKETVTCVRTAPFWDQDADAIYYGPGSWKKDVARWRQFGDDRPYHYLGSPWFFAQTGTAFGEAMKDLLTK